MKIVAGLFLLGALLTAQEFRATLQGTITDPSQAVVPRATVVLGNMETGIERQTTTDADGHYLFSQVVPGTYSLRVSASGFKTMTRLGIELSVDDNLRLDTELPLGQAAETVQVLEHAAAVEAETSSLGAVIAPKIVDTLPMKGHSSLFMFSSANGVVGNRYLEDTRPSDTGTNVLFTANGSPPATGEILVDGTSNSVNDGRGLYLSPWVPSIDAVGEISLLMGTLPAEYGRTAGIVTNVVVKSGTNDVHGSLYEFLRNSAIDANLFFQRGLGQKLVPYAANVYGGSFGAPIYFPHIYNGKNRTFFSLITRDRMKGRAKVRA